MFALRKVHPRLLFITALSLGACYLGARTGADVTTVFTFKGQQATALYISDDQLTIAEVDCIVGNDGNAKPTPVQKVWLDNEVDSATSLHYASTFAYVDFTGSYSSIDPPMHGSASCDATATGDEQYVDLNTWDTTDFGPVTIHGVATVGQPTLVENGVSRTIVRDRATGNVSRLKSVGTIGLNPSGTISVSSSSANGLPPINTAISSDWSEVQIVKQGTFSRIHH